VQGAFEQVGLIRRGDGESADTSTVARPAARLVERTITAPDRSSASFNGFDDHVGVVHRDEWLAAQPIRRRPQRQRERVAGHDGVADVGGCRSPYRKPVRAPVGVRIGACRGPQQMKAARGGPPSLLTS